MDTELDGPSVTQNGSSIFMFLIFVQQIEKLPRFSPLYRLKFTSAKKFRFLTAQAAPDMLLWAGMDTVQHVKYNIFHTGLCDCPGPREHAAQINGWIHCFPPGTNAHLLIGVKILKVDSSLGAGNSGRKQLIAFCTSFPGVSREGLSSEVGGWRKV